MTKSLAVIDGKSIFYRGYYAMSHLSLPDGTPIGGVYGFTSLVIELIKKLEPDYVAVAWDKRGTNIRRRKEIFPDYKAGRKPAPADFYEQMPILFELLEAFDWPLYELDDYEADDILGAFAKQASEKGFETYLLTSDLDVLQLVNDKVKVYALKNGLANLEEFDVQAFEKKYQLRTDQFLDLKALKGDASDNLPGVPGIGEKTAISLLKEYNDLDNIYQQLDKIKPAIAQKLQAGKELAYLSKQVGQIWTDAPVQLDWEKASIEGLNPEKVQAILKRLEFFSLLKRIPESMKQAPVEKQQTFLGADKQLELVAWQKFNFKANTLFVHLEGSDLWLAGGQGQVAKQSLSKITLVDWKAIQKALVVGFDIKQLYHQLAEAGVEIIFEQIYDLGQAEFLLNPLRRDFSLGALVDFLLVEAKDYIGALRQVYDRQQREFKQQPGLKKIAEEFDFPLIPVLFKMERRGIGLDQSFLATMGEQLKKRLAELEQEIFNLVGVEFNLASPSQLADVLFVKLQLPTTGIKKGKTNYSTGQKELDKLRGLHPVVELIEETRELAKLINTYIDALPRQVGVDGRIHTTFNQNIVSTGRLSSTNPNLQNIPVRGDLGRQIRQAFVPAKGQVFVSADYSQFELRLAAVLANDQKLVADFNQGIDIHAKTASDIYQLPIEAISKEQRRNAKTINFGVLYGMSPHGLSVETGMSLVDAKQFIEQYFELRRPIRQYMDQTIKQAQTVGFVETYFGRRRPTPDVKSSNFMVRKGAERAAINMPIQGTEADLMKLAMIKLDQKLEGLGSLILQVHDSLLVECLPEKSEAVGELLKEVMENICPELKTRLEVEVSIGDNWGQLD